MRRISILVLAAVVLLFRAAEAIDVNPSKDTIPRSSFDQGGNHFSIFNGDPKRIQRANEVDPASLDSKAEITPNPMSLKSIESVGPNPSFKITFSVHNHSKKTYTLSFPTSQRWDFRIVSPTGTVIYTYTDDHVFVPVIGTSMINRDDKLTYSESIEFDDLSVPLLPGTYTVEAVLANYPEIKTVTPLVVRE